ncbi:hypothetical protein Pla52n_25210 [Stieleria varia]|uniref:Recombinase A n=1 Tax=Stieleria varia TaxID=2528005 RepID=A0A5C6AXM7_9BACT|nr:hypothetical protein Pla52n_25210 [Stieleria varia]
MLAWQGGFVFSRLLDVCQHDPLFSQGATMAAQQQFSFMDTEVEQPVQAAATVTAERQPTEKKSPEKKPTATKPSAQKKSTPKPSPLVAAAAKSSPQPTPPAKQTPAKQTPDRATALQKLRAAVGCISTAIDKAPATLSTGSSVLDTWLPGSGLPVHGVTQWVAQHESTGAASLSMIAAANRLRQVTQQHGRRLPLIIVDSDGMFYPPAAIALGVASQEMILVRPKRHTDLVWTIDQALRCDAVAGVWASIPSRLSDRDARRFQLAAESGRKPAFIVRGANALRAPSFADVQFHVDTAVVDASVARSGTADIDRSPMMRVTLQRCRGAMLGQSVCLSIDDSAMLVTISSDATSFDSVARHETTALHLASQLAHPTTAQSSPQRVAPRTAAGGSGSGSTDRSDRQNINSTARRA